MKNLDILKREIDLVTKLSAQKYPKTLKGHASIEEQDDLKAIQKKLKLISDSIKEQYDPFYGVFASERSTGNPVSRGGALRRVWSGVYKGSYNKQYAAQISLVINMQEGGLDVGFYFGRTSSIHLDKSERVKLENNLVNLGKTLYIASENNSLIKSTLTNLTELGFKAENKNNIVNLHQWLHNIKETPSHSSITATLKPNHNGIIEFSDIDTYIALLMPLMSIFPSIDQQVDGNSQPRNLPKPLTPEQRAKQAKIRTQIGIDGEMFVLENEKHKLSKNLIKKTNYPIHQSMISDYFNYDILSCEDETDIYIEVKTTPRLKSDPFSKFFYMSQVEYNFYNNNIKQYRLIRVYDIYGTPELETIDLENLERTTDTIRFKIL